MVTTLERPKTETQSMPTATEIAHVHEIMEAEFAKVNAQREANRCESNAPDACQRCHEQRAPHCSACAQRVCDFCHREWVDHGNQHVPYVLTDPLTDQVIPLSPSDGYEWEHVSGECPTCGHALGSIRSPEYYDSRPICLGCRAGSGNDALATMEQMEAILAHHGTLTLRFNLDDTTRRLLGDAFRPEHRGEKVINVDAEASPHILAALDLVPSGQE